MSSPQKLINNQFVIFIFGLLLFVTAAILGWIKLRYGFTFLDEGFHMTESWRITVGDHFLEDTNAGSLRLYTIINSLFFRVWPEITLLDFRKIQYFFSIFSLLLFSIALFKIEREYWYQPVIFSLFAFTGLDAAGWESNLHYYTYPHFSLVLYLSFLLFALRQKKIVLKRTLFIFAGLSLWMCSLSLLHTSAIAVSPALFYIVCRKNKLRYFSFTFIDLCWVLAPFIFCWTLFIIIFNTGFLINIYESAKLFLSKNSQKGNGSNLYLEQFKYISLSIVYLLLFFIIISRLRLFKALIALAILSVSMFFIIDTSFFGLITPYPDGYDYANRQMFFASLIIGYLIILCFDLVRKHFSNMEYSLKYETAFVIMIPSLILLIPMSVFSSNGMWLGTQVSIPVIASLTCFTLNNKCIINRSYFAKILILIMLLSPFYYTNSWADWKWTFFDVAPEKMDATIQEGFGKGIKTNVLYSRLYNWIDTTAKIYSDKNDFMISYLLSPMVHMIAKRRPALGNTYISYAIYPQAFYENEIEQMKKKKREPKIAFIFDRWPIILSRSLKKDKYFLPPKYFTFSNQSKDPISRYIIENMIFIDEIILSDEATVKCFISQDKSKTIKMD